MALAKEKSTYGVVKPGTLGVKATTVVAPGRSIRVPNAETKQAIAEARAGIGVTRCKDINDLWDKLHK